MGEQSVITYRRMIFRSWLCSNLLLSPSKMSNCGQLNKKPRIENYAQQLCGWFQKTTLDNNRLLFPLGTKLPCNIRGVSSTVGPVGIVRPVVQHMQWLYEYICTTSIQSQNEIAGLLVIGPPGCGKSWSALYIIWKALQERKVVVYEVVELKATFILDPNNREECRVEGPASAVTVPELRDPSTVYVFDSKAGPASAYEPIAANCKTILFASACTDAFKQSERTFATVCFTSPSLHDMIDAGDIFGLSEEEVRRKHTKFGGSMRWVFGLPENLADKKLENAIRIFNVEDMPSVLTSDTVNLLFTTDVPGSHALLLVELAEAEQDAAEEEEGEQEAPVLAMERRGELLEVYSNVVWSISTEYIFKKLGEAAAKKAPALGGARRFV